MTEVDQSGRTPLDIARTQDHQTIFDILSKHLKLCESENVSKEPHDNLTTTWFDYYPGVTKPGL